MTETTEKAAEAGRGRLAQVIASRGGKAAPEAPFVIEHREALVYMLCEAAELEHGIMCQYLFAAFSLKQREEEGLTADALEAVLRWRKAIAHVATEEMLHLALVHNLLSAIGAAPHLARPNLPAPAHHYPAGVNLTLVPFGEPALRHFMFLERPEGMELRGATGIDAPVHEAAPLMGEHDIVPQPQDFATVGHLYRSIEHGIEHLAQKFGERNLFVGPPRAQATSEYFHWPELVAVTDLASAQQAIDTILEQGEGARGHWEDAHFGQFVRILDEYRQLKEADPSFEPARPVLFATVRPCEHDESVPRITEQVSSRCTDLFNVGYEVLLQMLQRYFAHTEETDAQLMTLSGATIALMVGVLKPLGDVITTLPVGPEHPGMTAGPSFELFYENDYLMPHREAAWALLEERLRDSASFCGDTQEICDEGLAARLDDVRRALVRVADSLASHFGDWGGVSRFAAAEADVDVAELRGRAAVLVDGVATAAPGRGLGALQQLFDGARLAFATAADEAPRAASRLLDSVMRPLAEALMTTTVAAAPPISESAAADGRADGSGSVDERVWTLARTATGLRASWSGSGRAASYLWEATAALQDLTLALTRDPRTRDRRLAELEQLQAGCEAGIRCAHDGPYLVTNASRLVDWLGEELPTRPQMALCRCGASELKPLCDGACAQVGFSDAKDPNRVPDRRDTYEGVSLTVLDNRGVCQHSGFCTDRLRNAFHTEGAFVSPSGARMDDLISAVRACPSGALSYAIDGVEARAQVDWEGSRQPTIEVTRDGPYRITGGIPLEDESGAAVERAEGSSLEHYALCRCGHSQNKPFCSGMHWYVSFTDPVPDAGQEPTIFEWAGGLTAFVRLARRFYEKHAPDDPLLAPLFADASADQPERTARRLAQVFGGPKDETNVPRALLDRRFDDEQRGRWVTLMKRAADEAGLPGDAEFRAAFTSYLEWESRRGADGDAAVPDWGWTPAGRPRPASEAAADAAEPSVVLPALGGPIRFEEHVRTLFRPRDRQSMLFAFDLWSYEDVAAHADDILDRVRAGTMPCDGSWPQEQVEAFAAWIDAGKPR